MKRMFYAALCAAFSLLVGTAAAAQDITLTLNDGSFSASGQLTGFDGEFYNIDTVYGPLTLAAGTVRCEGVGCPDPAQFVPLVRIAGAVSLGELLIPSLIESFATSRGYRLEARVAGSNRVDVDLTSASGERKMAKIQITLSSSTAGFDAMVNRSADIVMARRGPTELETARILQAYSGGSSVPYRSRVIGWENLRLYTNDANETKSLTVSQLIEMTGTQPSFWPGPSRHEVHLRSDRDSMLAMRQQLGLSNGGLPQTGQDTDPGVLFITPNLSLPLQHVTLTSTCGISARGTTFAEDVHPLSAPIYLFSPAVRQPPIVREFLSYALSVTAQRVVSRAGFLSRTPTETSLTSDQGILMNAILNATQDTAMADLQRAVRVLQGYGRLSLTFRYQDGTRTLDDVSKSNLGFLAELLQQGRYQDRDVVFAGFSDASGSAGGNLRLSEDRARALRDAILTLMGDNAPPLERFRAAGFGEALPLACNDTEWGKTQNRRVEIWIR